MRAAQATPVRVEGASDWKTLLHDVRREPTYLNHCRAFAQLRGLDLPASARRVALVSNMTVDPLVTCLAVEAHLQDVPVELFVAPYSEHAQQMLAPDSTLYEFAPDIVLVLLSWAAIAPAVYAEPWMDGAARRAQAAAGLAELTALLETLRARSRATIVVANFVGFEPSPLGLLDWQESAGIARVIEEINHRLADWARAQERVYVMDLAGLTAAVGREHAFDQRMRLLADQPFATGFLPRLGAEFARYLRAIVIAPRKCLVLDLDNTLWGGILGEDGPERLRLGGDAAGEGFREFQRAILALHHRGVLLALCSRNDEAEALAVVREHPDMILRPEHFAAVRINWHDKVANLRALASELNIGLDSLVFVDDDPFERQNVRDRLRDVLVVDLPRDPALYRSALLQVAAFDALHLTDEDRGRTRMYQERRAREQLRGEAESLETYLVGLAMEITVVAPEGAARTRLFQLVHKTNQFNLTTRRYSEREFDALVQADDYRVFGVQVQDRLGDNGIVGLVVIRAVEHAYDIESFLLSCRVLGRSIESAILAYVSDLARADGLTRVRGYYVPTAKNAQVRDLYARHGFSAVGQAGGADVWEADLTTVQLAAPAWARVSPRASLHEATAR
jgi:FkbH-like protein